VTVSVDVWLRGNDFATTEAIDGLRGPAAAWSDADVRQLLEGMLRAMDRTKRPGAPNRPVSLRGLSWIVNPFEDGVVVAIEITLGAAVAGPFQVDKSALETMIERVLATPNGTVH